MPSDYTAEYRSGFDNAVEHLRAELSSIRTGRASPQLVENIQVEAYESRQALLGLASITTPDSHTIQIEPWDKSIVKNIEKAIRESDLGFNPAVAGTVIRVPLPPLTEEGRQKLVKILKDKLEDARIQVRQAREDARSDIKALEEGGGMSEDEKFRLLEELDKLAAQYNDKIKEMGEEKEEEVMTV